MLTYNNGNNSPEALPMDRKSPILDMLTDALNDEYSDYTKYMELSEKIDDTRDSGTVRSMAYDEYKHRRLFEEIYKALTGSAPAEKICPKRLPAPASLKVLGICSRKACLKSWTPWNFTAILCQTWRLLRSGKFCLR